jgi:hypothetical protein
MTPSIMLSLGLPLNVSGAPYASDSSGCPWLSMQQLRCHVKPAGRHEITRFGLSSQHRKIKGLEKQQ